jgi:hypothetical protein
MEEAIKLAIEKGGYKQWHPEWHHSDVLDPLFWQALGRALGWKESWCGFDGKEFDGETCPTPHMKYITIPVWDVRAREWFEIRMSGGNEEKFWSDLCNTKH